MDFSQLQQSWQGQAAPAASPTNPAAGPASLLAETERMHRFGRRRNWVVTLLLALSLAGFGLPRLLGDGLAGPTQPWGLLLLALTMLVFAGLLWWGTRLRQAARPGLDSRAYLAASLRAFRFRRELLGWFAVPYTLGLGLGILLLEWPHFHANLPAEWWKLALWLACFGALALLGRHLALRRYEAEFGPTVRELARWQQALAED